MNSRVYTATALASLLVAILAWCGVGYFAFIINGEEQDRATAIQNAQQAAAQGAAALRQHAILVDTTDERARLAALFHTDLITITDTITAQGAAAGVKLHVSGARQEPVAIAQVPGQQPISAVGYSVDAQGSFSSLVHAIELLETLSLPSEIERFDLQKAPATDPSSKGLWNLNIYLHVFTSATVSS